jgi:PPK2 family polyphosphate:nucleotide phosphotransferase
MRELWTVKPGAKVDLGKRDPASTAGIKGGQKEAAAALDGDHAELAKWQARLWAESRRALLVVLQGMDASGKDGTIKHVFQGVNPQGTHVAAFKEPTPEELAHDFLWRVHRVVPRAGEIGIFNRSHYEDVLVVRVRELVPAKVWSARYAEIVAFEQLLSASGTTVLKIFLHMSRDEQKRRFEDRLKRPDKRWKFKQSDIDDRALWDAYQTAYAQAIERTSTDEAPWYVIPADHKWYRNWAISRILIEALRELDPHYPDPPDFEGVTIT